MTADVRKSATLSGMFFVANNLIKWHFSQAGTVQMFDEGSCSESEPFALQVQGDSMEPEFKDGCVIIIEPGGFIENECYVVAQNSDGLIFRQLFIEGERYILRPLNHEYDEEEIEGMSMIKGRVTQQAARRRKDRRHYA